MSWLNQWFSPAVGGKPQDETNVGRPFYDYANESPELFREERVALGTPALPMPSWMPEIHRQQARDPLDNTRSAMVRDLYGNQRELADWNTRLRRHIASFNREIRGGATNVFALPPLTSNR